MERAAGRWKEPTHTHSNELQSCHVLLDIFSCKDPIRATIYVNAHVQHGRVCIVCSCVWVLNEIEQSQHSARALQKTVIKCNY